MRTELLHFPLLGSNSCMASVTIGVFELFIEHLQLLLLFLSPKNDPSAFPYVKETRRLLQKHCCGYINVIHRKSQTLVFSVPSHYRPAPCAPTGSRPAVECGYSCSAMAAESPQCLALKERTHTAPIRSECKSGVYLYQRQQREQTFRMMVLLVQLTQLLFLLFGPRWPRFLSDESTVMSYQFPF